jgi:hypothetical protein
MKHDRQLAQEMRKRYSTYTTNAFANSLRAQLRANVAFRYVEGYILHNGRYREHAWLIMGGGETILDLTRDDVDANDYVPVLTFTRSEVRAMRERKVPLYLSAGVMALAMDDKLKELKEKQKA